MSDSESSMTQAEEVDPIWAEVDTGVEERNSFLGNITTAVIDPPRIVPLACANMEFNVVMRRSEFVPGCYIWEVRLYRGKGTNPPGWVPVNEDSFEDESYAVPVNNNG